MDLPGEEKKRIVCMHRWDRRGVKKRGEKKLASPGSHSTRNGVRTHVCIRTLELKSNALTTRPPWYATGSNGQIDSFIDSGKHYLVLPRAWLMILHRASQHEVTRGFARERNDEVMMV